MEKTNNGATCIRAQTLEQEFKSIWGEIREAKQNYKKEKTGVPERRDTA
jgi:hypothetical protein